MERSGWPEVLPSLWLQPSFSKSVFEIDLLPSGDDPNLRNPDASEPFRYLPS